MLESSLWERLLPFYHVEFGYSSQLLLTSRFFPAEPFYEPGFLSSLVLFIYNIDFSKHAECGQEGSLLVEHLPGGHKALV